MKINVPEKARAHFWKEPPPDHEEFWAFRWKPSVAKAGDAVYFLFDGVIVAEAIISRIEKPGESQCEGTGKFKSMWKVYWGADSFKDLRKEAQRVS